ncbi:MAG: hypothetical protein ACD_62C00003G0004 [uncultured bacterium]|nr:MAG: hypothetical protein ACD_62C00003G0004 [uncultured bacterium]
MRTIVDIPNNCLVLLKELCARLNESRSQIIRQAIEEYLKKLVTTGGDQAFGIWKKSKKNSLEYQNKLRDEWERT